MLVRLLQILLFFLPLHGLISVFEVPYLRFWKEAILVLIGCFWFYEEGKSFLGKKSVQLNVNQWTALGFLLWLLVLVVINDDLKTSLVAARYLGLGFGVFFMVTRLINLKKISEKHLKPLSQAFVSGLVVSLFFGIWAHFLGGYEVLQHWYSRTISSWVPGQTIPLYHETAGLIRMQGASSGPVGFGHLMLLGIMVLPFLRGRKKIKNICFGLLLFGIVMSLTRAVWIGVALYYLLIWMSNKKIDIKKLVFGLIGFILLGAGIFMSSSLREAVVRNASTIEHIQRPIEVFQKGLQHPFLGNLGEVGPAARARNLEVLNNDKAPIAENIFIDYFTQMGVLGLIFALFFWYKIIKNPNKHLVVIGVVFFFMANMASVFDMTPLSISFFFFLALLYEPKRSSC